MFIQVLKWISEFYWWVEENYGRCGRCQLHATPLIFLLFFSKYFYSYSRMAESISRIAYKYTYSRFARLIWEIFIGWIHNTAVVFIRLYIYLLCNEFQINLVLEASQQRFFFAWSNTIPSLNQREMEFISVLKNFPSKTTIYYVNFRHF